MIADFNVKEIEILEEIKNFITPLSDEEIAQLEENIIENGCKDPLTIWKKGNDYILIDGHHRFQICTKNNIPFNVELKEFDSFEHVQIWMVNHQMGRRNLTKDQLSYYRGKKYLLVKKAHGGHANVENKGRSSTTTSKLLAKEFMVGESTIKRDAKFAEGLQVVDRSNPKLKNDILTGKTAFNKGDIQVLGELSDEEKSTFKVKNEADLFNKIARIRKDSIEAIEGNLKRLESERHADAKAALDSRDDLFLKREERLERLKARMISSINRAIRDQDAKALDELQSLFEKLKNEFK